MAAVSGQSASWRSANVLLTAGASVAERSSDGRSVNGVRWTQLGSSSNPSWSVTPQPVFALATSADERLAASGESDGTIRVWDTETRTAARRRTRWTIDCRSRVHAGFTWALRSPKRVGGSRPSTMRSIHRRRARPSTCRRVGSRSSSAADGSWLAVADDGTGVNLIDTPKPVRSVSIDVSSEPVRSLAFAEAMQRRSRSATTPATSPSSMLRAVSRWAARLVGHTEFGRNAITIHPDGVVLRRGAQTKPCACGTPRRRSRSPRRCAATPAPSPPGPGRIEDESSRRPPTARRWSGICGRQCSAR